MKILVNNNMFAVDVICSIATCLSMHFAYRTILMLLAVTGSVVGVIAQDAVGLNMQETGKVVRVFGSRECLPNGSFILLKKGGQQVVTQTVQLVESKCDLVFPTIGHQVVIRYGLRDTGPEQTCLKRIWARDGVESLKLFQSSSMSSCLVWVDGYTMCLTPVPDECDGTITLAAMSSSLNEKQTMNLAEFGGDKVFRTTHAVHINLIFLDVVKVASGEYRLKAKDVSGKLFEFVGKGRKWRAYQNGHELPRQKIANEEPKK